MTELQLSLTRLLGKKDLSRWCVISFSVDDGDGEEERCVETLSEDDDGFGILHFYGGWVKRGIVEIIGHPATLSDFHRMLASLGIHFRQSEKTIVLWSAEFEKVFDYDSSKDLLDQDEPTLKAIISLIQSYERN